MPVPYCLPLQGCRVVQTGPHEIVLQRTQKPAHPWATWLIEQRNIDRLKERFRGESYFFRQTIHQGMNRLPIHLRSQTLSQYPQRLALAGRQMRDLRRELFVQAQAYLRGAEMLQPVLGIGHTALQRCRRWHRDIVAPQDGTELVNITLGDLDQMHQVLKGNTQRWHTLQAGQFSGALITVVRRHIVVLVHQVEERQAGIEGDTAHRLNAEDHIAHDFRRNGLRQVHDADQIALAGRHVTLALQGDPLVRHRVGRLTPKYFAYNALPGVVGTTTGGMVLAEWFCSDA